MARRRAHRNTHDIPARRPVALWRRLVALGFFLIAGLAALAWLQQDHDLPAIAAPQITELKSSRPGEPTASP